MIQVSMLPTQGISTRTCAGSPHSKFAGSTGAAECLDGVDKGPSATRRGDHLDDPQRVVAGRIRLDRLL
ncbi:MAG: hypothetical protein MUE63_15100 [Xanthomonadales bacterium]|nr:hypothetical protein [Xanthomonadales bacterium]